jgi:FMN phosphatase YigB (HAD superfamily)
MKNEKDIEKYAVFLDASGTILQGSTSNAIGVQICPDAKEILAALKIRKINGFPIKTGIITNWGNRINGMLRALNIDNCFDVVISSDTVEKGKPDPSVFHQACLLVGIEKQNAIHIGDSLHDDALGAQEAGLHGFWIRRSNYLPEESKFLKYPIFNDLNQILKFIEESIIKN